jgi:glutaconate CoA-transferase subunit A
MDKRMSAEQVVARIRDGMTIGIGGWGPRRKPMALVRELLRSPVRDLTVVAYGGADVGMLCAAGKLKKLVFAFVSLDAIPLEPYFRKARQAGAIEVMELDEGMVHWGLRAAAMRLPFLPTRCGIGTDIETLNPGIATIRSPYPDGELLLAMPALHLDIALCHANRCDEWGNAQLLSPDPFFDDLFCRAAKESYVSCEKVVKRGGLLETGPPQSIWMDRTMVTGVVEIPFGAHPSSNVPDYGIDMPHFQAYVASAKSDDGWAQYRAQYVDVDSHDAYLAAVGGAEKLSVLPAPVF